MRCCRPRPTPATAADLAPTHMRGRYQASYVLAWQAAMLLAPLVGGLALQYLGDNWWLLGALIGVAAALGNLLAEPARERRLRGLANSATRPRPDP